MDDLIGRGREHYGAVKAIFWGIDMSSRIRRDHLEVTQVEVTKNDAPEVVRQEAIPVQPGAVEVPYVEPEEYGLRVNWQSEPVGMDPDEQPVTPRIQESSRRRLARVMARMRDQLRSERDTAEPDG
jgi:hypothetical protein